MKATPVTNSPAVSAGLHAPNEVNRPTDITFSARGNGLLEATFAQGPGPHPLAPPQARQHVAGPCLLPPTVPALEVPPLQAIITHLAMHPDDLCAHVQLLEALLEADRLLEAEKTAEILWLDGSVGTTALIGSLANRRDTHPDCSWTQVQLAWVKSGQGLIHEAAGEILQIPQAHDFSHSHIVLARHHTAYKRPDRARDILRHACALNPHSALAQRDLATAYYRCREIREAIVAISRACEILPDRPEFICGFASALLAAGEITQAKVPLRALREMKLDGQHKHFRQKVLAQMSLAQRAITDCGFSTSSAAAAMAGAHPAASAPLVKRHIEGFINGAGANHNPHFLESALTCLKELRVAEYRGRYDDGLLKIENFILRLLNRFEEAHHCVIDALRAKPDNFGINMIAACSYYRMSEVASGDALVEKLRALCQQAAGRGDPVAPSMEASVEQVVVLSRVMSAGSKIEAAPFRHSTSPLRARVR